jgi:hypothetical protein
MSNAGAGPWWFTAVVAGITAFSTLLAGGLTTWLTLRYSNKRLAMEIKHQRSQERFKLLHTDRLELFVKLFDLIQLTQKELMLTVFLTTTDESLPQRTEQGLRQCYVRLQSHSQRLATFENKLKLLASQDANQEFRVFAAKLNAAADVVLNLMSEDRFSEIDRENLIRPAVNSCAELTRALRTDLGSEDAV